VFHSRSENYLCANHSNLSSARGLRSFRRRRRQDDSGKGLGHHLSFIVSKRAGHGKPVGALIECHARPARTNGREIENRKLKIEKGEFHRGERGVIMRFIKNVSKK
jgi:hypothetical protein